MVERGIITAKHSTVTMGTFGMVRQVQTLTGNAPLRRKVSHSIESQRFIHTPTGSNMGDDSICKRTIALILLPAPFSGSLERLKEKL